MLTQNEVRHIAKLSKINLTEAEVERLAPQLSSILDYFAVLEEVDTEGVPETSQVTGLESMTRPDVIIPSEIEDELINCTPHQVETNSVKIPKIM